MLTSEQVFNIVCQQLVQFNTENEPKKVSNINRKTSLIADLDFDSISLVGLAAAIEDTLEIDALPLMQWSDRESDRDEIRFTVGSFVDLCMEATIRQTGSDNTASQRKTIAKDARD